MSLTPQAIPGMRARLHMPEEILSLPVAGTGVVSDGEVVVQSSYGQIWCTSIRRFSCLTAPLLVRRLGI
ncbi:hypothetical protein MMY88_09615 [Acinetobacter baumannii]|uniref:hypothetical protein n=1 Tax=Acinetobacter baumannii TaxID=470 RepID=UPI0023005207|nr:hypothetical protein [Acinetobacter baumannii]MDA5694642.1 hypothetical protein [Acinetobacter baumannii]